MTAYCVGFIAIAVWVGIAVGIVSAMLEATDGDLP